MKLLIADDEILTRNGLISSIDWESLGIDQIYQAGDGIEAYNAARTLKPDIILSDIRMPRLSGIEFADKIKETLPDTSLIFMSGYSDKEYLKAAIRLKAITYVEKPLDLLEVREAVTEAVSQRMVKLKARDSIHLQFLESSSLLAQLLTRPYQEKEAEISEFVARLSMRLTQQTSFTSFIVKSKSFDFGMAVLKEQIDDFRVFLANYHLNLLMIRLHSVHHVFFVWGEGIPSDTILASIGQYLSEIFLPFGPFYISMGNPVRGISKAYQSYTTAVILLQSSFFTPANNLQIPDSIASASSQPKLVSDLTDRFQALLLDNKKSETNDFLDTLYHTYFNNRALLPNQVKDTYFRLFSALAHCRQKLKLISDNPSGQESILQNLEDCFSYDELHELLCQKTEEFFFAVSESSQEDSTIFMIKEYVSNHYSEEHLSIKEIGDHVFLSASYTCTYFKSQTGQTLNQYITEYRMERAMHLLQDSRYQITDISEKVGYNNGNYFGKSFKKFTGLTPSQYREKILG